jgi:hypothetical protein
MDSKPKTQLGKRKYKEAFGQHTYEIKRYNQEITDSYFTDNIGHGVEIKKECFKQKEKL